MSDRTMDLIRRANPYPDELPSLPIEPVLERVASGRPRRRRLSRAPVPSLGGVMVVCSVVVALAIAGAAILALGHGGHTRGTAGTPGPAAIDGVNPADVTVAVLNGTETSGLAQTVAHRLAAKGFHQGEIANAAKQTQRRSFVLYVPGPADRTDARAVARTLGLRPGSVHPLDPLTRRYACSATAPCPPTKVVVTVGGDLPR